MRDLTIWLAQTGMPVAEIRFAQPPALPYLIVSETVHVDGADWEPFYCERSIQIAFHSERLDTEQEHTLEDLLWAEAIPYDKSRAWLEEAGHYMTTYHFTFTEELEEENT